MMGPTVSDVRRGDEVGFQRRKLALTKRFPLAASDEVELGADERGMGFVQSVERRRYIRRAKLLLSASVMG